MEPIKTDRLLLRKIEVSDAPFFYELFNSEGWLQNIGDRNIRSVNDAATQIAEKYIPSYINNGYGSYLVIEKVSGNPVGTCGIYKRDNLNHPDIGFAFLPSYYRKGYGYESASAVLQNAKDSLGIQKVLAFTLPKNIASINLLQKLGFTNKGGYRQQGAKEELLLFSN